MDQALEQILNLLLEAERAGVAALTALVGQVQNADLQRLLTTSKEDEAADAKLLDDLIRAHGGTPSSCVGSFAAKVAEAATVRDRLQLLIHGEEWVARKIEEALTLAPQSGPLRDCLNAMARRHRFEVEWGRAELIRVMDAIT